MEIKIGTQIHTLRNKLGYTQEQLANLCNVTHVAISKWENHQSYPDISTLPILARIFKVSVDELLSYEQTLSEEEVNELSLSTIQSFSSLPFDEAFAMAKEVIRTYPNNDLLKLRFAGNWMYITMLVTDKDASALYIAFAKTLSEDLMASIHFDIRQSAGILLSNLYCMEQQYEKAEEILQSLPNTEEKQDMLGSIYVQKEDYKAALKHIQQALYQNITKAFMNISYLQLIASKTDKVNDIPVYNQLREDLQALFHIQNSFAFAPITKEMTDKKTALKNLRIYVKQLLDFDNINAYMVAELKNTLWFSEIERSKHSMIKGMMDGKVSALLDDPSLDYLRDEKEFKAIVDEVKANETIKEKI